MPPPAAGPLTAATIGVSMVRMRRINCAPARSKGSSSATRPLSRAARMAAKSPPAQNARPAPVNTTALTPGLAAARSIALARLAPNSTLSAFSLSGRFSVSVRTPSWSDSRTTGAAAALASATASNLGHGFFRQQSGKLLEEGQLFSWRLGSVLPAGRGQDEDPSVVEPVLLRAELAGAGRKFLVGQFAVKGHHARPALLE